MENTVRWSLKVSRETDEALREVRARTRGLSQARLEKLVAEAIAYARAVDAWRAGRFELVTSREQIDELKRAARYEKVRNFVSRAAVGRLVNSLRNAEMLLAR